MSAARYSFDEAAASLWRRRRSNVLSLMTITVALFVLGVVLLVHVNVQRWLAEWSASGECSVYLADTITPEQRAGIEAALARSPAVAGRAYVSPADAQQRFSRMFPELASSAQSLGPQALPASFDVRLVPGAAASGALERLAAELKPLPGVVDVRYDRQWINRLAHLVRTGQALGGALALVFVVAAAFTVASVVRLALHARRDEIEIMHLVGAPLAYIRGPFVAEGVLQGGIGAILALAALYIGYAVAHGSVNLLASGVGAVSVASVGFLPVTWMAALIGGGMALGCVGGAIASWDAR